MERLLVVDGSNLLFQMFYGMPSRISGPDGRPIQGTLGFIGALLKIVRMVRPTHVAVVFDGECHNDRCDLDADYKANRPDYSTIAEEENPFSQLPYIYAALDHLGIVHRETECCEADDWMASYAVRYGESREVVIASWDSDLWQLINENVRILRYRGANTVICDEAFIRGKLGIEPAQYADFKSLTGDHADNIRGADHVGPKTVAVLLRQFGSLEQIFLKVDEISKPFIRESICRCEPRLRTNQLLIRLDGTREPPFPWEEMTWSDQGQTTTEVMQAIGLR